MRFSEALGRRVVSLSTAGTLGTVQAFVVDPATRSVTAVRVKAARHSEKGDGDTLRWSDISGFGADAVMVDDVTRVTRADGGVQALSGKEHHLLGKRVLSTAGRELGAVTDVEFDATSGVVTALLLENGEVPGPRLLGVGPYAVVVRSVPDEASGDLP